MKSIKFVKSKKKQFTDDNKSEKKRFLMGHSLYNNLTPLNS